MDLYEAMRTTPATREFAPDPLPPEVVERILDHARFAASGRNAQPWRVIVVRDPDTKRRISELSQGAFKEYVAQLALETFDGGTFPPTGWMVVDNLTASSATWADIATTAPNISHTTRTETSSAPSVNHTNNDTSCNS